MSESTMKMKNQPSQSHWWWLDDNTTVRRSTWLQSTLTELNEKTKAMLKLIEGDADSFAQRAEMFYKKRPELVSMVEDFYRKHRLLAERFDQVRPESGIRLLTPSASLKHSQPEKLVSFDDDRGYDSYSESCDVEESVKSEIDDPEHEEEVQSVDANEVMKLTSETERLGEEKKTHKEPIKQKDDILDEVMKLREEIELLRKENEAHKDKLKQKETISNEVVKKLREEIEQLKKVNNAQKDGLNQKDTICNDVMKLRDEIKQLEKENEAQKNELKQKGTINNEVMKLREETDELKKGNETLKLELKHKDDISNELMKLKEEIERLEKENEAQKAELKEKDTICNQVVKLREENEAQRDELKQKDTICNEVMKLREELERHKKENEAKKRESFREYTICDEVMMLMEERESFREENRTQKNDLKLKDKEKIEVIRQLSSTIDMLKQENVKMRSFIAKESAKKWKTPFEFNKLIETFSGKLLKGIPRNKPSIVAL